MGRHWVAAILIAAGLSFAGKVVIASRTFGSTDALLWEANLQRLRAGGPVSLYRNGTVLRSHGIAYDVEVFNHPPLVIRLLSLGGWLHDRTGIPLRFWLRLTCAISDVASMLLLLKMGRRGGLQVSRFAFLFVVASPISLLVSGFHGNTDPIMMALLLLSVYLVQRGRPGLAGIGLGLAAGIKIVPLLFAPAIVFFLAGRQRVLFVIAAAGAFLLESLPLVVQRPDLIWSNVFCYTPQIGIWGVTPWIAAFGTEAQAHAYAHAAKGLLLALLAAISVWLNTGRSRPPIIVQCGLLAFVLLSLIPGFGVQYLAWLVPFSCLLSGRQAVAFHSTGALFLTCFYMTARNGFLWFPDPAAARVWHGPLIVLGLLCWLTIAVLTVSIFRQTQARRNEETRRLTFLADSNPLATSLR